ncbi:hypothetical protein BY458DRAFT_556963 [Sporodiniella umbellata]|nr:hypothetical protein BY458DRAFT_556963 [Sporodiniella umbellata]
MSHIESEVLINDDESLVSTKAESALLKKQSTGNDSLSFLEVDLWQIIQVLETNTIGELKLWILVRDQLHTIRLVVPRIFYLNSTEEHPENIKTQKPCDLARSSQKLPHSVELLHLYRVTMCERDFQAEQVSISNILNQPFPNSVFEAQMPLWIRAVLDLGAVCEVDRHTKQVDILQLSNLKGVTTSNYLSNPEVFNYIYLFHSNDNNGRHFFALLGSVLPVCQLFFVNINKDDFGTSAEQAYSESYGTKDNETQGTVDVLETMSFVTNHYLTEPDALHAINKALLDYQDIQKENTMLVVQSSQPDQLFHYISEIYAFPYITLAQKPCESLTYSFILKYSFNSYMELNTRINNMVAQAQYSNIPICNIPEDAAIFMSDILFSRELKKNNTVIWWSENADKPHQKEEYLSPEINCKSSYESVCADFDLAHLCINTLLVAPLIYQLEDTQSTFGYTSYTPGEHSKASLDNVNCRETLSILRSTVLSWMTAFITQGDKVSSILVKTFQRWVMSTHSCMYEPKIYKRLHSLMRKVFYHLVSELRALGADVVFANFHRIMITSNKDTAEEATSYFSLVYHSILQKQLFQGLAFKHRCYWDTLLWVDEWNFAGVLLGHANGLNYITSHWDMVQYLAPEARSKFGHYTSMFLWTITKNKHQYTVQPEERSIHLQGYITLKLAPKISRWLKKSILEPSVEHIDQAVEFIKLFFGVLNLDLRIEYTTIPLKRELLSSLANLSDFSEKAQFQNPVDCYKLTDICCSYCNYATDFDFRRDPSLKPGLSWNCKKCFGAYDRAQIELQLQNKVHGWLRLFQDQEIRCGRCKKPKTSSFQKNCEKCGGNFQCTIGKQDVLKKIKTIHIVAKEHQLYYLEEFIQHVLNNIRQ